MANLTEGFTFTELPLYTFIHREIVITARTRKHSNRAVEFGF